MRRRKSSINVSYHTKSVTWNHTRDILESLEVSDLENAATLSRTQNRIDDSRIRTLLNSVSRTCINLDGSDERKSHLFVDLKSSIVFFGLPIIFLTLNPGDNYSPLALFYIGKQIDPRQFEPGLYPYEDRVRTLLDNLLAVVEYFHTTVRAIINGPLTGGLFGPLLQYFGTIEYQGRGTPHLHLLVSSTIFQVHVS